MGLADWFRRLIARPRPHYAGPLPRPDTESDVTREEAEAWLLAMESGELEVPYDPHDAAEWDRYWRNQRRYGLMEVAFADMMSSDPTFIPALDERGARTILCVGNGLSSEAPALAVHGFIVTALDLSSVPADACRALDPATLIEKQAIPPIHRAPDRPPRRGGSLTYVTGDLKNADICPGPYDVVIERRTVQLFATEEQADAMDRLAARLAEHGLLMSHQHVGIPRPDQWHFAADWAADRGFVRAERAPWKPGVRVARLIFTTG